MKIKLLYIIAWIILGSINSVVLGKQSTIIFDSDCYIKVYIYQPIDNAYNGVTISDELDLKPNISITYQLDVSDFCFVKIAYSNGLQYSLIILENDTIKVSFKENGMMLAGSNANGNVYLNNFNRYAHVDSIFDVHLKPSIDIASINTDLYKTFWKGFNEDLDSLKSDENISHEFIRILSTDIGYAVADMLSTNYNIVLSGAKVKILQEDSLKITLQLDSIYQEYPPWSKEVRKYRYSNGVISNYYRIKYEHLSLQAKNDLLEKYEQDAFGPYIPYLLAPDHIQLPSLGSAFLIQLEYMVNEFNKDKMLKYIETRFSDSQYLDLIKERLGEIQIKSGQSISSNEGSIIIINEQVNSLEGLLSLNFLKGERLYIDLWATWCIPCKIEFEHKDELHSIAEKYNIKLVYLSIDDIKLKKKWESDIAGINLKGYHLLVNKSLLKDIEKVIYKDTSISIPRYIYINENGEIINDNAPRPRAITEIEKLFRGSESN